MPGFDDKLTRELERAARPAAPDPVRTFDDVTRRRAHRTVVRKIQVVAVVVAILAATGGTFLFLDGRFDDDGASLAPVDAQGTMTMLRGQITSDGDGTNITLLGVWAMSGDGENARPLFPADAGGGSRVTSAATSPDGTRIAYVVANAFPGETETDAVVVANADGSGPRIVARTAISQVTTAGTSIAWSPDGTQIAYLTFSGRRGPEDTTDVGIAEADGSGYERFDVLEGPVFDVDWAPDGSLVIVAAKEMGGPSNLWRMSTGGSVGTRLTATGRITSVSVSPVDGTVAFLAGTDPAIAGERLPGDVFILDPNTEEIQQVTSGKVATDLSWSPDGSKIASIMEDCSIWSTPPGGGVVDVMTLSEPADGCPLNVEWGPGISASFAPDPLPEADPSITADPTLMQMRPVLATYPVEGVGVAPELTCSPGACTPDQVAPEREVMLEGGPKPYLELGPAFIDASNLVHAEVASVNSTPGGPTDTWMVVYDLDDEGTAAMADATRQAFSSPPPQNQIAIVWDGKVINAPTVQEEITSGGGQIVFPSEQAARDALAQLTGTSPSPVEPTPEPEGEDIGLGTRMCDVQELGHLHLWDDGAKATAWTAYPVNAEGHCPRNPEYLVAVDVTGDGVPDASTGIPLVNCPYVGCFPLGATDLDADGDGELIVSTGFSEMDQGYFSIDVNGHDARITPILVAAPGHPAAGVEPGAPLVTSAGGDEGYASWIMCEGYPEAPVLVYTRVSGIVESDKPEDWHEVKLQLQGDGMFHVVDARDASLPPDQDPGWPLFTDPACGIDFNRLSPPNP